MPSIKVKGKEAPLRVFSVVNMTDKEQTARILKDLERIPKTVRGLDQLCVGSRGPHSMKEVRERW
jgi:predicted Zn-ribbon and HTH transcriptional regulator